MEKKYAYLVMFDYSTDDYSGIETFLFDTYEKALKKFKEIISTETNPEKSWVGDCYNKGNISDNYELDTNIDCADEKLDLWWNFTNKYDWNLHDFIDLKKMEIQ